MNDIFSLDNALRLLTYVYLSVFVFVMGACAIKALTDNPKPIMVQYVEVEYSSPFEE